MSNPSPDLECFEEKLRSKTETTSLALGLRLSHEDSFPREALSEEVAELRHVAEKVPMVMWLVAFTGAAQRFAFYGTTVTWRG